MSFLGDTLFRTRIVFPANVPPGDYQVQVLQFADGEVTGRRPARWRSPRWASRPTSTTSRSHQPALYGLASILLALARRLGRQRPVPQAVSR